jgi:hypothetical protein
LAWNIQVLRHCGNKPTVCGVGVGATAPVEVAPVEFEPWCTKVSVAVTGQIVVETSTVSVTTTTEALLAGQLVTLAAHEVRVLTTVVRTVDVDKLVVTLVLVLGAFECFE